MDAAKLVLLLASCLAVAGCSPTYCNDQPRCCRIETAPSSYVSECLSKQQCTQWAKEFPRDEDQTYPRVVYPANDETDIEGCKTSERGGPFGRLPGFMQARS